MYESAKPIYFMERYSWLYGEVRLDLAANAEHAYDLAVLTYPGCFQRLNINFLSIRINQLFIVWSGFTTSQHGFVIRLEGFGHFFWEEI